jgi:hypothetical protein
MHRKSRTVYRGRLSVLVAISVHQTSRTPANKTQFPIYITVVLVLNSNVSHLNIVHSVYCSKIILEFFELEIFIFASAELTPAPHREVWMGGGGGGQGSPKLEHTKHKKKSR